MKEQSYRAGEGVGDVGEGSREIFENVCIKTAFFFGGGGGGAIIRGRFCSGIDQFL